MSRVLASLALLGLLLSACSGGEGSPPAGTESPTPEPATTSADDSSEATTSENDSSARTTAPPPTSEDAGPSTPCDAGQEAEWLDLAGEGEPDAFTLGEGSAGVVLLHQNDGRACNWVPFAEELAGQGYAVIVPVMRSGTWPQPVIDLAAEHLREDGSEHVALVGASMGGTYAIAATPELSTPPDLVVGVSAPDFYRGASARDVIGDLDVPVLLLAAEHDPTFVLEGEEMHAAAQNSELVILPDTAAHGIRLLELEPEAATTVLDALREHAPAG